MSVDVQAIIKGIVNDNAVALFMKGTKKFPMCGFSSVVVNILDGLSVDYLDINILEDDDLRSGIKIFSDWPTIPQLYVYGEFVGGCDIIRSMFESGELQKLLASKADA